MSGRVLLAEDEDLLREILCDGLAGEGFEVIPARDGREALELFHGQGPFDVLLLDQEMPGFTGVQIVEKLRDAGQRVAVVVFSGNLELEPRERSRLGIGAVLRKPFPLAELTDAVRAATAS
jgi:CheY-like chemotaxis protein